MKQEIVDIIIQELLKHKEEMYRLEIKDRIPFIGIMIQEISGIPALYLPNKIAEKILNEISKKVKLSSNNFSNLNSKL